MSKKNDIWEQNFAIAKRYYEKHGNLYVPTNDQIHEGINLRNWVINQNKIKKKKKLSFNDRYKISKLDSIGMKWSKDSTKNTQWMKKFKVAKDYYKKYGNLLVPTTFKYKGVNLGYWIVNQRRLVYKDQLTSLDKLRIELLDSIGMIWKGWESDIIPNDWMNKFNIAKKWYDKHGNLDIPLKVNYKGININTWVNNLQYTLSRDDTPRGAAKRELVKSIGIEIYYFNN